MHQIMRGALSGLMATVPMTVTMTLLFRGLPARQQYPLPPVLITSELAARAGLHPAPRQVGAAALAAHFAYGAATGALYPLLVPRGWPSALAGPGYGLAVWSASYVGWIPALHILTPATQHPAQRNTLMWTAHVVWGAALVGFVALLAMRSKTEPVPARAAPAMRARRAKRLCGTDGEADHRAGRLG